MGLLALGTPLAWKDAKPYADHVREHGIEQLLAIYNTLKHRTGDKLQWGDEIEYMVISYDEQQLNARLSLRQTEILQDLQRDAAQRTGDCPTKKACIPVFHPEYGRYMLESTPGAPYGATLEDLLSVEGNMRFRRKLAKAKMRENEVPLTITSFPRMGAPGVFTDPYFEPGGGVARSLFLPDEITNPHVRFPTLTANIRRRRGSKVAINMPIYHDKHTPKPFIDPAVPFDRNKWPEDSNARDGAALPDHIYMDAMGFGMGCCCLQLTFQACSVSEARRMYDAFVPVGPIMLALTAAAPIFRGLLADVDCRWNVIAGSVDDRTREERGLEPLHSDRFVIPKSRYDSVDCYIYDCDSNRPEYNDNDMPFDQQIMDRLVKGGVDDLLAKHFAHLFIRDPIVIFSETLNQDDTKSSDHFENIQSTNWQTVRFKPPPPESPIGWRVEFRSMEVQITDYENAAFAVFIVLLTRAIMSLGLNFYIPISKVDENMHRAHQRDAIHTQKFYFRRNVFSPAPGHGCVFMDEPSSTLSSSIHSLHGVNGAFTNGAIPSHVNGHVNGFSSSNGGRDSPTPSCSSHAASPRSYSPTNDHAGQQQQQQQSWKFGPVEDEYDEFTINEIINGDDKRNFPGLMGVVRKYLDSLEVEQTLRIKLEESLNLVKRRADGSLVTTATWMRNFVQSHPAYKQDSVVSQEINYDLVKALDQIERGQRREPTLLPDTYVGSDVDKQDAFTAECGDVVDLTDGARVERAPGE
ncbi:glutamate--cysteine ligase [Microbotryomycetes sp. JL221]|nr:glutamate--cysteine ligase [Microbotryomycetes sp. JL221]